MVDAANPAYKHGVCDRWLAFEDFLTDMGLRPGGDYSLERKDNNGSYSPENCVWATASAQQQNKQSTRKYAEDDTVDTLVGWARRLGISKELAHWRFKAWGTFEKGRTWRELPRGR